MTSDISSAVTACGVVKPVAELVEIMMFCKQGHGVISHGSGRVPRAASCKMVKTPFENEMGRAAEI